MSLYSDAAKLDKIGRQKAWGVWGWIGNIPRHLRMSGNKKGGAIRLGFLPDVVFFIHVFPQITDHCTGCR